jgi:hypothetical protein
MRRVFSRLSTARPRLWPLALVIAVLAVSALLAAGTAGAGASDWKTVATDFKSPLFGLTVGPGGRLLVADAGAGPTKVRRNGSTSLIAPLPGVTDVAAIGDGRLLATTSLFAPQALHRISANGQVTKVADLLAFEQAVNPDKDIVESNPFDLAPTSKGRTFVADAAGNSILIVNKRGKVDWVATLPNRVVSTQPLKNLVGCPGADDPENEFICGLPARLSTHAVATTVAIGPDGDLYVGELRGFPATPGTSRVWEIERGARHAKCGSSSDCEVVARGFTSIIDIAFGRNGKAYVVELDEKSWLAMEMGLGVGGTVNVCRPNDEWKCRKKATKLPMPTAVAVKRNSVFTTLFSLVEGEARVVRLH